MARVPLLLRSHSVPVFEGAASRRHRSVPIYRLLAQAWRQGRRRPLDLRRVEGFLQFVGFPRSGHSLIGAILDAHPEAMVAHELDALGLIEAGVGRRALYRLIQANAEAFAADGRHWNGFCYAVPEARGRPAQPPRLIGDKKGDWVARRILDNPRLLDRLRHWAPEPAKWILVTRHPLDNIATMSLRKGRTYDRLRIGTAGSDFRTALQAAQADGRVPATVQDDMIADYRRLCAGVACLKRQTDPDHWYELAYERFVAEPEAAIAELLRFTGLPADPDFLADAASIVRAGKGRSRDTIGWAAGQQEAVAEIVASYDFLAPYSVGHHAPVPA